MSNNSWIAQLKKRFDDHMHRHPNVRFDDISHLLSSNETLLKTVISMEKSGGEPDVVVYENQLYYVDFSKETPSGRRNICYDEKARLARKKFPPETSAEALALEIGINILDESMYRHIQVIEPLDLKTSSWLKTPEEVRVLGGALFGDCRYQKTFVYHNGADSYYGVRGFRGYIAIT